MFEQISEDDIVFAMMQQMVDNRRLYDVLLAILHELGGNPVEIREMHEQGKFFSPPGFLSEEQDDAQDDPPVDPPVDAQGDVPVEGDDA